jgi:hypothetical protein
MVHDGQRFHASPLEKPYNILCEHLTTVVEFLRARAYICEIDYELDELPRPHCVARGFALGEGVTTNASSRTHQTTHPHPPTKATDSGCEGPSRS